MKLDRIEGKPDEKVAWGSDIAAQMLRRFDIPFISLNPGASYRGFHDSLVNHLGNENPGIILCLHEDHSVAIAHGYAKATGEPMACVLHSNVGLLHGMMGIFNAWCDRAPMIIIGATGPVAVREAPALDRLDSHLARPGRLYPLARQMGRPADLGRGARGIDGARKHVDPLGADCAGLRRARRRFPGDQARQGTGVAGHQAPPAGRSRRAPRRRRSTRWFPSCRTPRSRSFCSAAARARTNTGSRASGWPSGSAPACSPISSRVRCSRATIRTTTPSRSTR